jgi:hypothetical protein
MPNDPKRLQIIDRIVTVLSNIQTGTDYFYTPYEVKKRFIHWEEAKGFPTYMVFTDSGGEIVFAGYNLYDEIFYVNVKGIVKDWKDTVSVLEKCIRDVRKAINDDAKSGASGTLGTLCIEVRIEEPPLTDNGYLSLEGFGFFEQRIRIRISGDFGEL